MKIQYIGKCVAPDNPDVDGRTFSSATHTANVPYAPTSDGGTVVYDVLMYEPMSHVLIGSYGFWVPENIAKESSDRGKAWVLEQVGPL